MHTKLRCNLQEAPYAIYTRAKETDPTRRIDEAFYITQVKMK